MLVSSFVLSCAIALAQEPPGDLEGALRNDTYLPTSSDVAAKLAAGDNAWERRQGAAERSPELAASRTEAFDAWQRAIAISTPGDCVPGSLVEIDAALADTWPDPDDSLARRTESIECAVLRRLSRIDAADLAQWCERFAPLAERELAAAGSEAARLAVVERAHPCTEAAAAAALRLFDLAFESGRLEVARGWIDRAQSHALALERAGRASRDAPLAAAIAKRRATSAPVVRSRTDAWESARALTKLFTVPLAEPAQDGTADPSRPGIAFLSDGTAVVQSAELVYCVSPDGSVRSLDLVKLGQNFDWRWQPIVGRRAADWPLLPASDGARVVVVAGRAQESSGNALLCIDPGDPRRAPALHWGYAESGWRDPIGREVPLEQCLGPGLWSFEPGPAIAGTEVIVQARQWVSETESEVRVDEGRTRAWCLALDVATGAVRWKRFLATGADAHTDPSLLARLRAARQRVGCAQPLGVAGTRVLVGTELGVAALLDVCDGRPLWSVRSQRREFSDRGWTTASPPVASTTSVWHWAPSDSRFLYRLRNGADLDGRGVFEGPPTPIGEMIELVGAGASEILALARAGDRRTLSRLDTHSGRRDDAVPLGRDEVFTGAGLASPSRVLFASTRALYLVDRERGLYVLQRVPLESEHGPSGGSVFARGDRVFVVNPRSLTVLRAE